MLHGGPPLLSQLSITCNSLQSFIHGLFVRQFDPAAVELHKSRGYETYFSKQLMRWTVILSDMLGEHKLSQIWSQETSQSPGDSVLQCHVAVHPSQGLPVNPQGKRPNTDSHPICNQSAAVSSEGVMCDMLLLWWLPWHSAVLCSVLSSCIPGIQGVQRPVSPQQQTASTFGPAAAADSAVCAGSYATAACINPHRPRALSVQLYQLRARGVGSCSHSRTQGYPG
eukprot:GHUV01025281.1.p1 GENE.GHUV01025281.1~~GHUV01025281.1.p1  ORF type:complete len:225 (+),score=33.16 GHUV01025281.1:198-872(+)